MSCKRQKTGIKISVPFGKRVKTGGLPIQGLGLMGKDFAREKREKESQKEVGTKVSKKTDGDFPKVNS